MSDESWNYLVPRLRGSAWDKGERSVISAGVEPRVALHCPHEPLPWLLGSFVAEEDSLEGSVELRWTWTRDYPTGDDLLIRLQRGDGKLSGTQFLAGNEIYDRKVMLEAMTSAGSQPAADEARRQYEAAQSVVRAKVSLRCGICSVSRSFRMENVQRVAQGFWDLGILEVPFDMFARRVDRRNA